MAAVLVTDGEARAALAVVRSLGRGGYDVFVCSPRRRSLAGASLHCQCECSVPSPLDAPEEYVDAVTRLVSDWGIDILVPISEASLMAMLPHRARFRQLCIPFALDSRFSRISDKAHVMEVAQSIGIAVPEQHTLATPDDRRRLEAADIRFPVVVKPARSVTRIGDQQVKLGAIHASDWQLLQEIFDATPIGAYPLLVQQRIVGPGLGLSLLLWDREVVAAFSHRRLREKPLSGGVSVYRESIRLDARLLELTKALLAQFDWEGVAMVEYKIESPRNTPYLMEINGRFWGSLQLAVDAGVDFPRLLVAVALDQRPEPVLTYCEGVRTRWWWGDVDHLLARLRYSGKALALPANAPGRSATLLDFLRWRRDSRTEVLRLSDPLPFVRETLDWLRGR